MSGIELALAPARLLSLGEMDGIALASSGASAASGGGAASYADTVLADSPLAYWKLDETSGTNAADSSGNANSGTYSGTLTLNQAPLIATGKAVLFGGGRVTLPNVMAIPTATSAFSMESWVSTTNTQNRSFLSARAGGGNPIIDFGFDDTGHVFIQIRADDGSGLLTLTTTAAYNDGAGHHLVATRTTAKLWTIYVDGSSVKTGSDTMSTGVTTCDAQRIAVEQQQLVAFSGTIDEVAVYNTTLSASRVLAHYSAGIA